MEGYLYFKRGLLRFRKVEMKNYWFVLKQDPTSAEFQYVLTWYKNETKTKLKGSINLLPSMTLLTEESKQFMLGYYFIVKTPDNDVFHFSSQSKNSVENWVAKIREALMTDVYAGTTRANKFMRERVINMHISNTSIALVHPLAEQTILSWRLSQILSFVFNETEFSFSICSKCNKCSGRFAQQVSLETGIFVVGSLEERLAATYPGEKLFHEKTISGDIYRVPHSCQRIDNEAIYVTKTESQICNRSKLLSFPLSCISVPASKPPKPHTPLNQPKYKRCPTPTSFTDPPNNSPSLPFTRHSSVPPTTQSHNFGNYGYDMSSLYLKSALTSPVSVGSYRPTHHSQEDLLSVQGPQSLPKSPSMNTHRYLQIASKPFQLSASRPVSHINPPISPYAWDYSMQTRDRIRHGSAGDQGDDPIDSPYTRESITPHPIPARLMYPEDTLKKLSIISELEKSYQRDGPCGYESNSLPNRRRRFVDHRPRPSLRSNTFQFPVGLLPVKLMKEPNYSEGGKIVINDTEYQIPRMIPEGDSDSVHPVETSNSSDGSIGTPPKNNTYTERNKQKRFQSKRKTSTESSTISSTTLSEVLPYSQEDSDSGPDRITLL